MFKIVQRNLPLLLFLSFPLFLTGQATSVDAQTERIDLHNLAKAYVDATQKVTVEQLLSPHTFDFQRFTHLNIGITYKNVWLNFSLQNTSDKELNLLLAFSSAVNDSIFLYKIKEGSVVEETALGEALPFAAQAIQYKTPVFPIHLKANEQVHYFLKSSGMGQPMNLTAHLLNTEGYHRWDTQKMFFLGLVYGILILISLFNVSFFLVTNQRIYLIFLAQLLSSILCLLYFDGFVHQYLFPNSGYWSNETIAIALCSVFVFFNFFFSNFFDVKRLAPLAHRIFSYVTYSTLGILLLSFIHPWGFNFFIAYIVITTSVVGVLLLVSVFIMRRLGVQFYFFFMLATVSLIIFGSMFQLFTAGFLPDVFVTHYAMHLAMVFLAVFLAFGVNDKFRLIQKALTQRQLEAQELKAQNERIAAENHWHKTELETYIQLLRDKTEAFDKLKTDVDSHKSNESQQDWLDQITQANILTDEQWRNFKFKFENVHTDFFNRLQSEIPTVTESEKRLIALTKLEMSNNEIAAMLGISPESVTKTRYRLRKKVGEEDLDLLVERL